MCAKDGGLEASSDGRGGVSRKRRYVSDHAALRVRVWKCVSREVVRVEAVVAVSAGVLEGVGMK